jgi:hypothetical protein
MTKRGLPFEIPVRWLSHPSHPQYYADQIWTCHTHRIHILSCHTHSCAELS